MALAGFSLFSAMKPPGKLDVFLYVQHSPFSRVCKIFMTDETRDSSTIFLFFFAMDIDMEGLMMIYFVFLFHFLIKMLCLGRCLLFAVSIFTVCCMGRHHPRCSSSWIIFPALIKRQSSPQLFTAKVASFLKAFLLLFFLSISPSPNPPWLPSRGRLCGRVAAPTAAGIRLGGPIARAEVELAQDHPVLAGGPDKKCLILIKYSSLKNI